MSDDDEDIVFDEESFLLFCKNAKTYSSYSQDSLSSTAVSDSVEALSIDDVEEEEKGGQQQQQRCHDGDGDDDGDNATVSSASKGSCGSRLWESYYAALVKYPLVVKSLTAFVLLGFADVIAQCIEWTRDNNSEKGPEAEIWVPSEDSAIATSTTTTTTTRLWFNWYRVARFGFFGLAGAPWTHYYYAWLDTVLPPTPNPWTWTTATKVIIDQFLQAPALLAIMISGMALMEWRGISGVKVDMANQYMEALVKNWELWIPATVINIAFVKPDLRVLYDNLVFFFWTIFLSMLLNESPSTAP